METDLELQRRQTIFLFNLIKNDVCLNQRGIFSYNEDDMCIYYEFRNSIKEKGVIIYIPSKYDNEMEDCTDEYYERDMNNVTEYEIWIKIGIVMDYGEHVYERIKDVYSIIELTEELLLITNENVIHEMNNMMKKINI